MAAAKAEAACPDGKECLPPFGRFAFIVYFKAYVAAIVDAYVFANCFVPEVSPSFISETSKAESGTAIWPMFPMALNELLLFAEQSAVQSSVTKAKIKVLRMRDVQRPKSEDII